jgi:hypothetical protein
MKTHVSLGKVCWVLGIGLQVSIGPSAATSATPDSLIVHEWGTFTSVQSADGKLLEWRPLETSRLPDFVYNWTSPGPGVMSTDGSLLFGKGAKVGLQRMETPVIYFYGNAARKVNVQVDFPNGLITEWYPQASVVGPSTPQPQLVLNSSNISFGCGAITMSSRNRSMAQSGIVWKDLLLMPESAASLHPPISTNSSALHYYAARETDSLSVVPDAANSGSLSNEIEKFLFYRGVGSFATPLQASMPDESTVRLANTDSNRLSDFFVLSVHQGKGVFTHLTGLQSPKSINVSLLIKGRHELALKALAEKMSSEMTAALRKQGLFPREAQAMVNTWQSSWFQEEGTRVLYILSRKWTDQTLPLAISPSATELVRVMVGRAELLSGQTEKSLEQNLTQAVSGNAAARQAAIRQLRGLGRFAETALWRATKNLKPEQVSQAYSFLALANSPAPVATAASL